MDDGGGVAVCWTALSAIAALDVKPLRTVRMVLWTSEELGGGAAAYWDAHSDELPRISVVMETDAGAFSPAALQFTGSATASQTVTQIGQLLVRPWGDRAQLHDVNPPSHTTTPARGRSLAWASSARSRAAAKERTLISQ